ncbi:MAG: hypothetical protein WC422_00645 [Candidatus Paceibacterota bacterium]
MSGDRVEFMEQKRIGIVEGVTESSLDNDNVIWVTFSGDSGATFFEKKDFKGFILPDVYI